MKTSILSAVIAVFGLGLLLAVACDTSIEPSGKPAVEAVLNVPFTLSAGQTAVLAEEKLSVTFARVVDDTRCPVDVQCVQAGNATMSFLARKDGKAAATLGLALYGDPLGGLYEGFGIHVQQLMPARLFNQPIRPEDYSVSLLVDRP